MRRSAKLIREAGMRLAAVKDVGAVLIVGRCQRGMMGLAEQVVKSGKALLWHSRYADAIESLSERRIDMVLCQRLLADGDWTRVQQALRRLSNPPPLVVLLTETSVPMDGAPSGWRLVPDGPPISAA